MDWITVIGFCAAVLTTGAYLPQTIKTIRTKQVRDLSLIMYAMINIGIALWAVYGIVRLDFPVMIANIVALCFNIPVLVLILKIRLWHRRSDSTRGEEE